MERIITEKEWNEVVEPNIEYVFDEDSYFAELKEIDVLSSRVALLQTLTDFVPTYFSQDFVRRHVLFQTDEEIEELAKQREREKDDAEDNDEVYNDVSGDKTLSIALSGGFDSPPMVPSTAKIGATSGQNTGTTTVNHTSGEGGAKGGSETSSTKSTVSVSSVSTGA